MKKLSLQLRLIFLFIIISASVFLMTGAFSWYEGKEKIDEFFDTYQVVMARKLASLDWNNLNSENQAKIDDLIKNVDDDGEEDDDALGFAVFNRAGERIFSDNNEGKYFHFKNYTSGFENQKIGRKKEPWRIFWIESVDKNYIIAIGQELDFREDAAFDLVEETILPWIIGLSILLLVYIYMIQREFRPLKKLAYELRCRSSQDLSPVQNENMPEEIKPLTNALNALFVKINDTLNRERSFIADAAHELRSPLAALKIQAEIVELSEDDNNMRKNALDKLNLGIIRAYRLIEQLLELTRLEAYKNETAEQSLDWEEIISQVVAEQQINLQNKNISLECSLQQQFDVVLGYPILCALMVRNLLDNAIKYSPEGAIIKIISTKDSLQVFNSGAFVDEKYLPRLKERFFRPAGQAQIGSGLGLSIVNRIARLHHCYVKLENVSDGFLVSVCKYE